MPKLTADVDTHRWVAITESFGFRGRGARKKAIGALLAQASAAMGRPAAGGSKVAAWAMSQAAPALMRKAAGRVLVWVWKSDPELLVVMAQVQEASPQLRTARAMMPMEFDDTENFRSPFLGVGEKLAQPLPAQPGASPSLTYTWDTGTHFVTVTAICHDRERFGTIESAVDDLARTVRLSDDLTVTETPDTLRIDPA